MYNMIMEDLTSIKKIKQELKESEERFRLAMLGANDFSIIMEKYAWI